MATNVTSYVMRVSDLDRSIRFYREVFECSQALREPDAALLLTPSGFHLYLCLSRHHGALPIGGIGVEQIVCSADSEAELHRIEGHLR